MSDLGDIIYKIRNSHLSDCEKEELVKLVIREGPSIDIDSLINKSSKQAFERIDHKENLEKAQFKKNQTLIVFFGSLIVILLAIIAFLLYWNSPEKIAARAIQNLEKNIESISKETEKNEAIILISEMRSMRAATIMAIADMHKEQKELTLADIMPYLGRSPIGYQEAKMYRTFKKNSTWYLARSMSNVPVKIRRRIAEVAKENSLLQSIENQEPYTEDKLEIFMKCN